VFNLAEELHVGRVFEIEREVTLATTADHYGNKGVEVFATPALIALLEETAIGCVAPTLTGEQGTVGTRVEVQHLAATPVGMKVTARAELVEIDGRRLVFNVEARDERELVAKGTHERFIINSMQKFLARAMGKARS